MSALIRNTGHLELPVQTEHNSPVPTEQGSSPGAAVPFPGLLCSSWKLLDPAAAMGAECKARIPSVLPSAVRVHCIPCFGKRAELLGAVLSKSWDAEGEAGLCFCFQLDPAGVGWAVRDSFVSLSLTEQWGWGFIASQECCPGYLWEFDVCGALQSLAAG